MKQTLILLPFLFRLDTALRIILRVFTHGRGGISHLKNNDGRTQMNKNKKSESFIIYVKMCTYMDKPRLCEAHPFREQANLTRSWCNEVALCRTSSWQRAFKSCRWLVGRTRNTTAEGPSELSWGTKSDPTRCREKRDAPKFTREKLDFCVLFYNSAFSVWQLSSREQASKLPLQVRFHTVKSSHRWSAPPPDAFAPCWGGSTTDLLYRHTLLIRGSKWLQ